MTKQIKPIEWDTKRKEILITSKGKFLLDKSPGIIWFTLIQAKVDIREEKLKACVLPGLRKEVDLLQWRSIIYAFHLFKFKHSFREREKNLNQHRPQHSTL